MEQMLPTLFSPAYSPVPVGEHVSEHDINFDRTLPGLHKYLGGDFVEVAGRTYMEPYTNTQMYAFFRSGVILVPGQTLPLIPYGPFESNLLQKVYRERKPLAFLPGCFDNFSDLNDLIDSVGTTADLVAIRISGDEVHSASESTVRAIFVGRQRIQISKLTRDDTFPLVCHGKILPELSIDPGMSLHPLGWGLVPKSWSRFGSDPRPVRERTAQPNSAPPTAHPPRQRRIHRSRSSRRSRDSNSSSTSSGSLLSPQSPVPVLIGNPLSVFNTRLSTWRHFGPITSGRSPGLDTDSAGAQSPASTATLSSYGSSATRMLDHFVDDTAPSTADVSGGEARHTSAPELPLTNTDSQVVLPVPQTLSVNGQTRLVDGNDEEMPLETTHELSHIPTEDSTAMQVAQEVPSTSADLLSDADIAPDPISTEEVELIVDRAVDRDGRPFRYRIHQPSRPSLLARRDVMAATAHTFTGLPFWVHRQYDLNYLVTAIQVELLAWNNTWQVEKFSPDLSVPFSYWLVQNLPIPGTLKARILGINHVVQRLRALLDIIRRSSACVCAVCDVVITSNRFIICLAREGSFQTYVNPSGVLHDIVTVSQVFRDSVILIGSSSEEYSWFPGYSWTITNCSSCSHHLGWLFTAARDDLRPKQFWGIRRDAIVPGPINSPDWYPCL